MGTDRFKALQDFTVQPRLNTCIKIKHLCCAHFKLSDPVGLRGGSLIYANEFPEDAVAVGGEPPL